MQTRIRFFLLFFLFTQTVFAEQEILLSALNLDQATKQVTEANQSKVLGATTEIIDGKKVHIIKILTSDGRVQYLKVDESTGKTIK